VVSPESVDDLFVDIFLESSGFSDRDRLEYAINVNAITPGYMATDNTATIRADENRNRLILERIPDGRWGEPDDLQGCAVFLASPASDYVHGYTFAVDGGWLAR
jgi:2-deoxy-D-gluconate 3-dehydrogenase